MSSIRQAARNLGLGRAALALYHRPLGLVRKSIKEGGPFEQRRTEAGRLEMIATASRLPPLACVGAEGAGRVAFLSGREFWYQTLFCFVSLQLNCPVRVTPVIFDDGTLTDEIRMLIRHVVPWTEFINHSIIQEELDQKLPASRYPTLRARRLVYPHLRKLTDIHLGPGDWKLVMDSDMLFFRKPEAVLDWFGNPQSIYMQDIGTMYGYPAAFMEELAGCSIPPRVNVGLCALQSDSIDWDRLEYWCSSQMKRYGPRYLQEQGLTAMLLAKQKAAPLSRSDYVVLPTLEEGRRPTAVLHHYVAHSKRAYFQHGWKFVACRLGAG